MRHFRFLAWVILLALVGCTGLPFSLGATSLPASFSTPGALTPTPLATLPVTPIETTDVPAGTGTSTPAIGGSMLRVWLPPEFDPNGNSPASALLKARLEKFAAENPNLQLEVRVKAVEGSGGLLDALVAANVAAPLALPDLVLLPRGLLESATIKGLLFPYDGLTGIMDDTHWYDYARQLARVQTGIYGIPFAGDAMVLAYHPSLLEKPSIKLEDMLTLGEPILFQATDQQALFTLCLYLAENGSLQDKQGRPFMDKDLLTRLLEFDQRASLAGVMPYWLTQYSNDAQVWEAFLGGQYPLAITWASTYLNHFLTAPDDLRVSFMPTLSGTPHTLATGWSWALTGQEPVRRMLAVKLAEYLVDQEFLGKWTYAAGYLPPLGISFQYWPDGLATEMADIEISASLIPPVDILSSLGPILEGAVVDVLKAQSEPQAAAQAVMDQINHP